MSYEIRADYRQQLLLPPSVEDWVGPDHPARFIREVVDALDLVALGFAQRVSFDGRPNYAADLLVKVWLYGYMNAIRSSRKVERACREHMGLIWLTGNQAPDHNTLWRFWRDYRAPLRQLLKALSRLAMRSGLIELVLHAVDGTKVVAQAARAGLLSRERLEKDLALLDAAIEEVIAEVDRGEAGAAWSSGYRLPEQWQEAVQRREQLRELLTEVERDERGQIHPLEPAARLMPTRSAGTTLTHNAQVVVDSHRGLIVASDVLEESTDNHALVHMLEEVHANLEAVAQQTVADAGYYSGEELARAQAQQFEVLVHEQNAHAKRGEHPDYHHRRFTYDAARDCWVCPRGEALRFEREKWEVARDQVTRLYRCSVFRTCPVRAQCSSDPRGRSVRGSAHQAAMAAQHTKQQVPGMKERLAQRARIVEQPFGIIKEVMGFRRFPCAGRENIRTHWALVCVGFNLLKLFGHWCAGTLAL
jgi:transposase